MGTDSQVDPPRAAVKFVVDEMLGRLARWLRILGFDTAFDSPVSDDELIRRSIAEDRVLVTRDRALAARRAIRRAILIESVTLSEQLEQVLRELALKADPKLLFSRCLLCNAPVEPATAEQVRSRVPAYVLETQGEFRRCAACDKLYWPGTHWQHVIERLRERSLPGC